MQKKNRRGVQARSQSMIVASGSAAASCVATVEIEFTAGGEHRDLFRAGEAPIWRGRGASGELCSGSNVETIKKIKLGDISVQE